MESYDFGNPNLPLITDQGLRDLAFPLLVKLKKGPVIIGALEKALTADDLTKRLDVAKGQLQIWLKQAVADKKIRKLPKPIRYIRRNR
mgnify:CR=1 FL=1